MQDRDEPTLELSLFAEAFQEMLAHDFGNQILKALYTERQGPKPAHSQTACPARDLTRVFDLALNARVKYLMHMSQETFCEGPVGWG